MWRPRKSGLGYCTKFTGKRAFRTKKLKDVCTNYVLTMCMYENF